MADTRVWRVYLQGQEWGPYTTDQLQEYIATGQMDAAALVMCHGMTGCKPAHQVIEPLFPVVSPPPLSAYAPSSPMPVQTQAWRVKVRAKRSRGDRAMGTREFTIRVIDDSRDEHVVRIFNHDYEDWELRQGDTILIHYHNGQVSRVENETTGESFFVYLPRPAQAGCLIMVLTIGLAAALAMTL